MEIRAGIIGLGVGEAHIKGYESHKNCKVTKVCDFDKNIKHIKKNSIGKIEFTTNPDDILTDPNIDVVSIASYDNFHFDQIMKAIKNDKHIFVEKPLCLYENKAEAIFNMLEKKPHLKISSNLILRQSDRFIDLKAKISKGVLGDLFFIAAAYNYGRLNKITNSWRGQIPFYSVTYGGGVHVIDLILWLSGQRINEVASFGNNICSKETQFKYNDLVSTSFSFDNGATGQITSNFGCVFPHFHKLDVYGTKATFVNDVDNAKLYKNRDNTSFEELSTAYPGVHKGDLLKNLIQSIYDNKEPKVGKKDVFETMSVCFAIEKSINSNKKEKVNYFY